MCWLDWGAMGDIAQLRKISLILSTFLYFIKVSLHNLKYHISNLKITHIILSLFPLSLAREFINQLGLHISTIGIISATLRSLSNQLLCAV